MNKPNKAYFLDKWFAISDRIRVDMQQIFERNNVPYLRLELLPKQELELWQTLRKKTERICQNIAKIINEK